MVISTPEYAHGLPGVFKNALDWLVSDPAFAGKPVVWCVDHPDPGVSFLEGRPSQPLVWSNDSAVLRTGPKGHCSKMVAIVEGAGPEGLMNERELR